MKTFRDKILECENPKEILKYCIVDSTKIEFTAEVLKSIMLQEGLMSGISNCVHNSYIITPSELKLMATLKKLDDNTLAIEVKTSGGGKIDCPSCDGTGVHYCYKCDSEHDCGPCNGTGEYECIDTGEDEVLYYETISLNQGELF